MKQLSVKIPSKYKETLLSIGAYAEKLGTKAWVVGGAVRDFYLKRETLDMDLTFEGNVEPLANLCVRNWGGKKRKFSQFGTFRVDLDTGLKLDLVRARKEVYSRPAALPVVEPSVIKEDLFRRDFTVNAWALSILPGEFGVSYDPFGAQKDIQAGLIRVLHKKSFLDDPTRLFRALRFAGRFNWKLAPDTQTLFKQAVREQYPLLLSRERLSREFIKILEEKDPKPIFSLMSAYGLLPFVYPGLEWFPGLEKAKTVEERLGVLACGMGKNGDSFLKSLHIKKEWTQEIYGAWEVAQARRSPLNALSDLQERILRLVFPELNPFALAPCFVRGKDLKEKGFSGGKISSALEKCCQLQWEGKVSTQQEAFACILPLAADLKTEKENH